MKRHQPCINDVELVRTLYANRIRLAGMARNSALHFVTRALLPLTIVDEEMYNLCKLFKCISA